MYRFFYGLFFLGIITYPVNLAAQTPLAVETISKANGETTKLYNEGKYQEALELALKTLAEAETELGQEHPYTLASIYNLALLYEAQGRYG